MFRINVKQWKIIHSMIYVLRQVRRQWRRRRPIEKKTNAMSSVSHNWFISNLWRQRVDKKCIIFFPFTYFYRLNVVTTTQWTSDICRKPKEKLFSIVSDKNDLHPSHKIPPRLQRQSQRATDEKKMPKENQTEIPVWKYLAFVIKMQSTRHSAKHQWHPFACFVVAFFSS